MLRVVAALVAAGVIALAIWVLTPRGLRPPINIVGYPTFANFDFHPGFLKYRLVVWVVPAVATLVLAVLWRWGPLSGTRPARRPEPTVGEIDDLTDGDAPGASSPLRLLLILPAAGAIALAVSSRHGAVTGAVTWAGVLAGLGFTGAVLLLGLLLALRHRPPGGVPLHAWLDSVTLVNGPASAVGAALAVCIFARSTAAVSTTGQVDGWSWVPGWAALLTIAAAAAWAMGSLYARVRADVVERRAAGVLAGSAVVFMATGALPGPVGQLAGFDDMQSVTGADLLTRGFFPWRDVTLIHGVFEDALRSWAGFALFEHTMWATAAAAGGLWTPLGWVAFFLFALWVTRGRWLPLLCLSALLVWGSYVTLLPLRWWLAPIIWILLGEAVRRSRARWTALLIAALLAEAVLVPEAAFQVLGVLAVLVLHDLVTRPGGRSWWRGLTKTRDAAVTGAVLTLLWCGFLALHHSLKAFVDYYLIFGPGHAESGALPFGLNATRDYEVAFFVAVGLVVLTLLAAGWILVAGRPVSTRQWVMLGCALTAGLYGEKALARWDDGHLGQSIFVAVPLAMAWVAVVLSGADDALQGWWSRRRRVQHRSAHFPAVSLVVLAAILVGLPAVRVETWHAPSSNKALVLDESLPLLGYSTPATYDKDLLADLDTVVDGLGGRDDGFFDFTNSPGWFYYMLGLDPSTSYYHVSMAVPAFSQEDLVRQLEKDPPSVVAFDSPPSIGLSAWDFVSNEIRHFVVSQYLLDGWTPVLSSHGVVFMLRNDLLAGRPTTPELTEEPQTTDLYFAANSCDWGFVPNFLQSPRTGRSVSIDAGRSRQARRLDISGWAFDLESGEPPTRILVAAGRQVIATATAGVSRPDVAAALHSAAAATSGFTVRSLTADPGRVRVYAEYADGQAHPLTDRGAGVDSLTLPDGEGTLKLGPRALGSVDSTVVLKGRLTTVDVPPDVSLPEVKELSVTGRGGELGRGDYLLTDTLNATSAGDRTIQFRTLFRGGRSVSVRVGSCLQWHGYTGHQLYLFRRHGFGVGTVTLSGLPHA
ncbi:MAG TPA: hypothetical protein VFV89_18775 [Nocardioides sp.]|uniref:hypothetical protein n=1 Tax=Nocardioides sp. TaxID=35761 RepID=UPI002E2EC22D|nr:hypothetical protein [Nocardioides sp.]HEX5089859.1 hypothetical protein [Nocardioides sp.]